MTTSEKFIWNIAHGTKVHVTVFLINGYQMHGKIADGDASGIILYSDDYNTEVLIPMGAISTIVPTE